MLQIASAESGYVWTRTQRLSDLWPLRRGPTFLLPKASLARRHSLATPLSMKFPVPYAALRRALARYVSSSFQRGLWDENRLILLTTLSETVFLACGLDISIFTSTLGSSCIPAGGALLVQLDRPSYIAVSSAVASTQLLLLALILSACTQIPSTFHSLGQTKAAPRFVLHLVPVGRFTARRQRNVLIVPVPHPPHSTMGHIADVQDRMGNRRPKHGGSSGLGS